VICSAQIDHQPWRITAYDGNDNREETRADTFINSSGYTGNTGSRTDETNNVYIAFIEEDNNLVHDHKGFYPTSSLTFSRIQAKFLCSSSACSSTGYASNNVPSTHASTVMSIAAGSIDNGQDPNHTTTAARRARGGISSQSELVLYGVNGSESFQRALEAAVSAGADIVNASLGYDNACDPLFNPSGINTTISLAVTSGVLVVVAAGNDGGASCTINHPAIRPPVLAVAGLNSSNASTTMANLTLEGTSSRGGAPMLINGASTTTSAVGIAAPAVRTLTYGSPTLAAYSSGSTTGSSFAAPVISGQAADFIDMLVANGLSSVAHNPRLVKAAFYVMADRDSEFGQLTTGTSNFTGSGRSRIFKLNDAAFGTTRAWVSGSTSVNASAVCVTVASHPLPAAVTQFKVAAYYEEQGDFTTAADIDVQVREECSSSCTSGFQFTLGQDNGTDITRMVSSTSAANRCVQLRFVPTFNPGNRIVYWSYIYQSGSAPI
jgi:hypothetical protein